MEKHAAQLVAARHSAWKRELKGAGAPVAIDALSPHTRGGGAVTHPTWGEGTVLHASDTLHRGTRCITATVRFNDRSRSFDDMAGRWVDQGVRPPWPAPPPATPTTPPQLGSVVSAAWT